MNPYLLVLLGVAAFLVIPNFVGLAKLDISLKSVIPLSIEENKITLNAGLQFKNNSSVNLIVKKMACDVLLNGQKLGTITQNLNVPLLSGRSQIISNYVEIRSDILGEQLWRDAINMNLQNFVLQFAGDIWINNIKYPFLSTWTIEDFINAKGHQRTSESFSVGFVDSKFKKWFKSQNEIHKAFMNDIKYVLTGVSKKQYDHHVKSYINDVLSGYIEPVFLSNKELDINQFYNKHKYAIEHEYRALQDSGFDNNPESVYDKIKYAYYNVAYEFLNEIEKS